MNKTTIIAIVIIVIIIVVVGIWYGLSKKPAEGEPIKIGVLTPLTGPAAPYGEDILKGIKCAEKFINENSGINGIPIKLITEDSECDGATAVTAATKLVDVDGVVGIIGQACSAATIPVGGLTENKKFVLIACAASNPKVTESSYVFRVNPNDLLQGKEIARHIKETLKMESVSILVLNDEYGNGLVGEFNKRFSEFGGVIQRTEWFESNATDFRTQITKLSSSEFEILFIIAAPTQHPQIAKQLKELGKDWERIAEFNFGTVPLEAEMMGTIYPTTVFKENLTDNAKLLKECMQKDYGEEPDILVAWGFDALHTFVEAAKKCSDINAECVKQNLIGLSFDGASGPHAFTEEGEITQPRFEFVESQ